MRMHYDRLHNWDLKPKAAIALQKQLADQLVSNVPIELDTIHTVAGVDVCVKQGRTCACIVVLTFPDLDIKETVTTELATTYPYIPGLLTFREGPALELAFGQMKSEPDVLIFDGMGQLHPRRMGIAAHLGLWLGRPTIGCGKRHLIGEYDQPGMEKGSACNVRVDGDVRGVILRTRANVKPVYVSVGHLADLESAVQLILACTPKYRLPRPIRQAHLGAASRCDGT